MSGWSGLVSVLLTPIVFSSHYLFFFMKRIFFFLLIVLTALQLSAQEAVAFRYGCISYDQILKSMPEYVKADSDFAELKAKYDKEMKASEEEFNAKYVTFLSEQSNYAPSILRKRQSELEDMMKRNEQFRLESIQLLENAHQSMIQTAKDKLNAAIRIIAAENQLAFVLNTDSDAVPYLDPEMAVNITDAVLESLK